VRGTGAPGGAVGRAGVLMFCMRMGPGGRARGR
jgi:hypothetical protein